MSLQTHPHYQALLEKAHDSHQNGRSTTDITDTDIAQARLYCHAFRIHTIGAFHATRITLENIPVHDSQAAQLVEFSVELLKDLADLGMDVIPEDFRALISTFHRYERWIRKINHYLKRSLELEDNTNIRKTTKRFVEIMEQITSCNGIFLTRDTEAPSQASFVVPNLGITIVPLVYGDYHSWNLAYLAGEHRNVPVHRHQSGVEIHLGYPPINGLTILGKNCSEVLEGYAMAIPPETDHGFINYSDEPHHVPFIFGSCIHGGWGVFLDVDAVSIQDDPWKRCSLSSDAMNNSVFLTRAIENALHSGHQERTVLIDATQTHSEGSGGLELAITPISTDPYSFQPDSFRAVSVVHGQGTVEIAGIKTKVVKHDHFGIPGNMSCSIVQNGVEPLVLLDSLLQRYTG